MPVWFSFALSAFAAGGFFATLFLLVTAFTESRRMKASPQIGIAPGVAEGQLGFWVNWSPSVFPLQFFRIRVSHYSPETPQRQGTFSVSFDPPLSEPFLQYVELPEAFKTLLAEGQTNRKSLFTVDARTVDGFVIAKNILLADLKKIYFKQKGTTPKLPKSELIAKEDLTNVSTLEYAEWVERKKKIKSLMEEAKAKAARAKPAAPKPAEPVT